MINSDDLNTMTTEQLKYLAAQIKSVLEHRFESKNLIVYTHDCKDGSGSHMRKYKHWAKLVTSVDLTKTNGYAFVGDFLRVEAEHKLVSGSIVVECCGFDVTAYRIVDGGKEKIANSKSNAMSGLIDTVYNMI